MEESLVGIFVIMFVKRSIRPFISDIATSATKLGIGGNLGNKGACAIRMKYKESTLAFACCHLESGRNLEV